MTLPAVVRAFTSAPPGAAISTTIAAGYTRAVNRDAERANWSLATTPTRWAGTARRWRDLWTEWRTFVDAEDHAGLLAAAVLLDSACGYTLLGERGEQWIRARDRHNGAVVYWLIKRWQLAYWKTLKPSMTTVLMAVEAGQGTRRAATAPPVVAVSGLTPPAAPWLN